MKTPRFWIEVEAPLRHASCTLLALALLGSVAPASAGLGRAPATAAVPMAVQRQAQPAAAQAIAAASANTASAPATSAASYSLHQSSLDSGTTVQEYVDVAGRVFALAWRGPVLPDLADYLGDYLTDYRHAAAQHRAGGQRGGALRLRSDALVLHSGGRMRAFVGYAYVPALVPAGLDVQTLLGAYGAAP